MFEKFSDYMYYLLFTPLHKVIKSKNQFFLFFKVIGKLFDKIKSIFFMVREESMISTASAELLNEHARDRQMTRYIGEDIENFRNRLCMKFIISELAGSEQGVLLAVKSLGFEDVESVPCYLIDRERWAEFYIIINLGIDQKNPIEFCILKDMVRSVKQASAKDNYRFVYNEELSNNEVIDINMTNRVFFTWWKDNKYLDGRFYLDGTELLDCVLSYNNTRLTNKIVIQIEEYIYILVKNNILLNNIETVNCLIIHSITLDKQLFDPECKVIYSIENLVNETINCQSINIKKNFWQLNGDVLMDGRQIINAYEYKEEL